VRTLDTSLSALLFRANVILTKKEGLTMPRAATTTTTKKTTPTKKQPSKKKEDNYSDPKLRERLKKKILAGDKGGDPGEWSARKAQLLTKEYEKAGGGYKSPKRTESQKHLEQWTEEEWTTSDGGPSERKGGKTRYLPQDAWEQLSAEEKQQANETKRKGDKAGKQFVPNPKVVKEARKRSQSKKPSKKKDKSDAGRDPLTT
jgi:hypothetical protein